MKLDTSHMRYLSKTDFRVLTAIEMGSKNHLVVPTPMILSISGLRNMALLQKSLSILGKINLVNREKNAKYDGYKLTYHGYDYLALKAMVNRESVLALGTQIGIGKESDIFTVADKNGKQLCLKVHRLGRTSFKAVKKQRDYLGGRQSATWIYFSRLSAQKEWAFMKALHEAGFSVPVPIDTSRHHVVMSLVPGTVLRKCAALDDPARVYALLMDFALRLANNGLVHCDLNEFNIMICDYDPASPESEVVVIDFPQCVSIDHANARELFERDVDAIRHYFKAKYGVVGDYPRWEQVSRVGKLDMAADASGTNKKALKQLEKYQREMEASRDGEAELNEDEEADDVDDDDDEDDDGDDEDEDVESGDEESAASESDEQYATNEKHAHEVGAAQPPTSSLANLSTSDQ